MAKSSDVLASEAKEVLDQIIAKIEIEDSNVVSKIGLFYQLFAFMR